MLLNFCLWAYGTVLGHAMRSSIWIFPIVEIFHLLGLSILGGTLLIVNMRLLGMRVPSAPAAKLWRELQPWMAGGLVAALLSGFMLFASESSRLYYNPAFRYKMLFLALALVFTFTVHRKVSFSEDRVPPLARYLVAAASILLWSGVGIGGRMIGYLE